MANGQNTLLMNESLLPNQALISNSGKYQLKLQPDGNLVVYDVTLIPNGVKYSFGTQGHVPKRLSMQSDGNLVLYDSADGVLWQSQSYSPTRRGVSLIMQDDGNLVLYGITPLFQTQPPPGAAHITVPIFVTVSGENGLDLKSVVEVVEDVITIVALLS